MERGQSVITIIVLLIIIVVVLILIDIGTYKSFVTSKIIENDEGTKKLSAIDNVEIIKEQNRLKVQEGKNASECPENCTCVGSTIKCEINGGREMIIQAGKSGNTIVQVKGVNMSTNVTLYKSEGKLYGEFKRNITKEIKVMPDVASETALNRLRLRNCVEEQGCSIELKEVEQDGESQLAYELKTQRQAKVFRLFKAKMQVQAQVNAESGEVIRIRKPWWAFLASEPEE